MKDKLKESLLIEQANKLINDEQVVIAESITRIVQIVELNGIEFALKVSLERV